MCFCVNMDIFIYDVLIKPPHICDHTTCALLIYIKNKGVTGQRGETTPTALGSKFTTCSQTTITSGGRGNMFWKVYIYLL